MKTPAAFKTVEVEGRFGIVFERVTGVTMLQVFRSRPWLVFRLAKGFAELHAAMHACQVSGLPSMQERLIEKIQTARPLPVHLQELALSALQRLPVGSQVCHGDFHPDNILMTEQGPVIIDWIDATAGHPLGDLARTALLTRYGALPPEMPLAWVITLVRDLFYRVYIRRYCQLTQTRIDDLNPWLGIVAAARLNEGIDEEEVNLLRIAQKAFSEGSS